jgi:hypothetical protein
MAYPIPKIIYDPGTGATTLTPTYPNIQKPYMDNFEAVRHDSITSDGNRQSITERVDRVRPVNFEFVPWTDLAMWDAFFSYAIQGGTFQYYPDGTATAFATWQLVDDKIAPAFVAFGLSKFSMSMRLVPGGASST